MECEKYDPEIAIIKELISRKILRAPNGFWTMEIAIKAMRYTILEYYKYSKDDIYNKFTIRSLDKIGLRSVRKFGDIYDLVSQAVPEFNLLPWELKKLPDNFWNEDRIKEAMNWLVYEVLSTIPKNAKITQKVFDNNKLGYLSKVYGRSPKKLLEIAFPPQYFN